MKRRQKRKIAWLVLLFVLLAALGVWYWNFRATRSLTIDLVATRANQLTAPTYLYAFGGTAKVHLQAPVGVAVADGNVFVADSTGGLLFAFRQNGTLIKAFGQGVVSDPVYLAQNPKDGLLYVTDRGKNAVLKFKTSGEYVGTFDPNLPKDQLPGKTAKNLVWSPIAIAFGPDGTMYVTEILKDQRMLIFAPDGTFTRSVGSTGVVSSPSDLPGKFQFPNSLKVYGSEVWVVDSNNRRIQVFTLSGDYKRLITLTGLPRGLVFVSKAQLGGQSSSDAYVVVDTLASMGTVYSTSSAPSVTFGEKGTSDGQFNLPNDIALGDKSVLFVTDTQNERVQAWGWKTKLSPIPAVLPSQPLWCLLALPLLLVPLIFRKKQYFATADFVRAMAADGALDSMRSGRVRWLVSESDFDALRSEEIGSAVSDIVHATEYSDSDARIVMERYSTTLEEAAMLTSGRRAKLFLTESEELRKLAKMLEIDTMNAEEFRASVVSKKR